MENNNFDEKLGELLESEIRCRVIVDFSKMLLGYVEGSIDKLLPVLRSKTEHPKIINFAVLYLFSELVNEGKIEFDDTTFFGDENDNFDSIVYKTDRCEADGSTITINPDGNKLLTIKLCSA